MIKLILPFVFTTLIGCSFGDVNPTWYTSRVTMDWFEVPRLELHRYCQKDSVGLQFGCIYLGMYDSNNGCTLFTLPLDEVNDKRMTTLGHETAHCYRGAFHIGRGNIQRLPDRFKKELAAKAKKVNSYERFGDSTR